MVALDRTVCPGARQWSLKKIRDERGDWTSGVSAGKTQGTEAGAKETEVSRAKVPTNGQTTAEENGNPVPELERVMTAVQSECRKLVKLEKEEIRHQILADLQLERRLYLNAILLMGATPKTALNAPQIRQVQQFITSLQQISCVLHKNTQALLKIYGLEASNAGQIILLPLVCHAHEQLDGNSCAAEPATNCATKRPCTWKRGRICICMNKKSV